MPAPRVNAKYNDGATALILAAAGCDPDIVRLLIDNCADIHAKADNGSTALTIAQENNYNDIAKILRDSGGRD